MRVGVKICGISSETALDACVAADVDWVGFVFFDRSPRHVTPTQAARLIRRLSDRIRPVGLFVAPDDTAIEEALAEAPLAALQIYAPPVRISDLRRRFSCEIWHACPISTADQLPARTAADRLLIEASAPGAARPGGNGARLNWPMLIDWVAPTPWMLAGGLTPGNVATAIRQSGARAVDVSSGVEDSPGSKDPRAIHAFTEAARSSLRSTVQ